MKNVKFGIAFIIMGLLLIAAALSLAGYNLYSDMKADRTAKDALEKLAEIARMSSESAYDTEYIDEKTDVENTYEPITEISDDVVIPDYILDPNMKMPTESVDGTEYIGILEIPSLELELPIISEWDYNKLKTAPCRYSGSVYKDDMVICGHDYRAHFGNLKHISEGDEVIFTDMDGNVFTYTVEYTEVLSAQSIDEMLAGDWDMTLFTCTADGRNRFAVRLGRKKE